MVVAVWKMIPSQPEVPPDERIQDSRDPGLIALYHSYSRNGDKALPENCELDWGKWKTFSLLDAITDSLTGDRMGRRLCGSIWVHLRRF